ncbi:Polysaccharide lyase [Nitrosospira sp. Nl5]|uniref:polysaccharide lyase n=1 Tax=Nitrosospira sp. Nl5 TaxID=200120 RepID=UPI0008924F20|nr:polysaccharide lyase [Nitrosospira sp. Nl5]SCY76355.1 Polysaccharide lyase [Nitrosospira sp. Nl5]
MNYRLFSLARFIVLLCISASAFAQVDNSRGGAVPAEDFYKRYNLQSADPANIELLPDPAGSGKTVLRARVRNTDEKIFGGFRTEIVPLKEFLREGVRWYALSVYFPENWQFHPSPTIIGQLHTSQKNKPFSPPVALIAQGHDLNLELHFNHRNIEGPDAVTRENTVSQKVRLDKIRTQQWYCFVIRADWSHTPGSGSLSLWMNGDKAYESLKSPNAYQTQGGNYPKAGLYLPGSMMVPERSIYLDFIHLGGPKSSYAEMAALTPCQK